MPKRFALIPAYNEASTVAGVLDGLRSVADAIVLVDDGSRDDTGGCVERWREANELPIYLLRLPRNRGMSGALRAGLAFILHLLERGVMSGDDLVINIDADGQHRGGDIERLCRHLEEGGFRMALARRDLARYPLHKRLGNYVMSLLGSLFAGRRFHDIECGLRVFRAEDLRSVLLLYRGRRYSCAQELAVIFSRLGLPVSNTYRVDVPHYRSNTKLKDVAINLAGAASAWLRCRLGLARSPEADVAEAVSLLRPRPEALVS